MKPRKRKADSDLERQVLETIREARVRFGRCAKCNSPDPNPNCSLCRPPKKGRRPGPRRCVIQIRERSGGKVRSVYSITVITTVGDAMRRIQDAFWGDRIYSSEALDAARRAARENA